MPPAKDYRELRVYQLALESAIPIYEISKAFPAEEHYSLIDQMRCSSRSICANLAEAWRKRRYPKSFVSKVSDADGEAAETLVWLDFALRLRYISAEVQATLMKQSNHICSQLTRMMAEPEKWTPRK